MGGKGDAHFRAPKKPKQKENETKRNEKRVKDALPRQKLSVAKQSRAGQDGRGGKGGERRGGKATLRLQMAWRKQEQQQHANDNVVALREAATETSGWERGGVQGGGRPAKSINVMAQLEGSHPKQEPRHRPRPRPKHRPKHRPENENEREHENETRDRARCPMPSSGVGLV